MASFNFLQDTPLIKSTLTLRSATLSFFIRESYSAKYILRCLKRERKLSVCSVNYELTFLQETNYSGISEQWTLWDQYKFKWFVPCIEVVLFKRFQSHYIDRGDKIWGFSFVHCGEVFNTVSLSRSVR